MHIQLPSANLQLRNYKASDIQPFSAMSREQKFQRFYSEQDCTPSHWQYLVDQFSQEPYQQPRRAYNLVISDNDQFIGCAGIRIEDNRQASIGCALMRNQQHSGIARQALTAITGFGFNELNMHRIYAETIAQNKAAIRLCRQLGMRQEAELVEHRYFKGQWWNTRIFAILKSEFASQCS